jgi:GcrA cell cycle regulator
MPIGGEKTVENSTPLPRLRPGAPLEQLWPAELTAELHRLFAEDELTCSQMAAVLGRSRNAVIAKCHREGLLRGNRNAASVRGSAPKQPYTRAPWAVPGLYADRYRNIVRKPKPIEFVNLPAEKPVNPVTLMELTDSTCRWPVSGDGAAMLFCGAANQRDLPYCSKHCGMAYRAPLRMSDQGKAVHAALILRNRPALNFKKLDPDMTISADDLPSGLAP